MSHFMQGVCIEEKERKENDKTARLRHKVYRGLPGPGKKMVRYATALVRVKHNDKGENFSTIQIIPQLVRVNFVIILF